MTQPRAFLKRISSVWMFFSKYYLSPESLPTSVNLNNLFQQKIFKANLCRQRWIGLTRCPVYHKSVTDWQWSHLLEIGWEKKSDLYDRSLFIFLFEATHYWNGFFRMTNPAWKLTLEYHFMQTFLVLACDTWKCTLPFNFIQAFCSTSL